MTRKQGINWFRLNRELHRDIGYFCIGLTLVFAISGIALNHLRHWNPNYIVDRQAKILTLDNTMSDDVLNAALLSNFDIDEGIRATYWESPQIYKVFFEEGGTLTYSFTQQQGVFEHVRPRQVFKQFNRLHLNEAQNGWIAFSDLYAVLLIFLSLSALFMVKGKYSPWRFRRGWLVIAGGVVPAIYIFIY